MNETIDQISERFFERLNELSSQLISIYSLKFDEKIPNLSEPLHRWMDFRMRYIDPEPRTIFASCQFPKRLPNSVQKGLKILERKIQMGIDINGYQSKGLIKFNDVSSSNRAKRTDLLWADWRIHHLHITDIPITPGEFFSIRKCSDNENWLLFCFFLKNQCFFVDIRKHDDENIFEDHNLLKIVYKSWPQYIERYRLNGVLGTSKKKAISSSDRKMLRVGGLNTFFEHDGKVFHSPGGGITSASTSLTVSTYANKLRHWINYLATNVANPDGFILQQAKNMGIENPNFEISFTPKGLIIIETSKNIGFEFSSDSNDPLSAESKECQNLFLPNWALATLFGA